MKSNYNRIPKINWIEEQTNKQQGKVDQTYTQTNQTVTTETGTTHTKSAPFASWGKIQRYLPESSVKRSD